MTAPVDNGLTEAQADALSTLAHIAIGSLSHSIERHAASALLEYMGSLETQRTEARAALTAAEQRLQSMEHALIAEQELTEAKIFGLKTWSR